MEAARTCFVIVKSIKRQSLVQNQDKTDHSQERQSIMKEQRLTNSILREDIFGDECDEEWQKAKSA